MNKQTLKIFLCISFFVLFVLTCSQVSAKNPFKPFLPEKPKRDLAAEAEMEAKNRAARMVKPVELPKIEVKAEPPTLNLSGLIWNSSRPQAIINGQVVAAGDVISEVKIKKITRDGVEGDFKGVKVYLKP